MKKFPHYFAMILVATILLGLFGGTASALSLTDSGFTKIATLPNTYNAAQGMCADDKYIYTFQSEQGNNAVAHFVRTTISSGANVVMKYTDDTSITNFVELGHGNDMCAVVHEGVTYIYLTTMYHKAHSTYKTHSIWKFKVSGNTIKKVAYYDVVQGTTNRNFTGLTLYKQDEEKVILLGCLDNKFYQIDIPHNQASGEISCTKAFNIDYSTSLSIPGAPKYNYTNSSGTKLYLVQGMHYSNGRIYYLMTASTANTPRSKNYILVYDISTYPTDKTDRKAIASESIYMTSSTYNYFMELESLTIRNGIMYFGANAGKSGYYEAYDFVGKLKQTFEMTPEYTVDFCDEAGSTLQTVKVKQGETAKYTGTTPTKAYDNTNHYTFKEWLTAVGGSAATLTNVQKDMKVYAGFTATAHSYSEKITTNPSCSAEGLKTLTCSCGKSYTETIAKTEHTPKVINTKTPTCTEEGYTGDTVCSVCNTTIAKGSVVAMIPHEAVVDAGYAATCTKPGLSDGTHCKDCGKILTEQTVLPILPHNTEVIPGTPATCMGSGLTDGLKCKDCGATVQAQTIIPRLGHDYRYVNNGDTHTGNCSRCNKTITQSHSYVNNTCVCGSRLGGDVLDDTITIQHSLNLASDISINYGVKTSLLADYDSYYLECNLPVYESLENGNTLTGSRTVVIEPVLTGSYYYFTLNGVTAVNMNDEIIATLHMTKGNETFVSPADRYSVATYAYNQLNKDTTAENLKALCANLLRYGAAAQTFKGYRTDALADMELTEEQKSYLVNLDTVTFGNHNKDLADLNTPAVLWVGKSLLLDSKVVLRYVVDTASYKGNAEALTLRVTYQDYKGQEKTVTVSDPQPYGTTADRYSFDFDSLLAAELRSVVHATVFAGDTQVSNTMEYSVDTYGNNKTGTLGVLCKALFAYSDCAKEYFVS